MSTSTHESHPSPRLVSMTRQSDRYTADFDLRTIDDLGLPAGVRFKVTTAGKSLVLSPVEDEVDEAKFRAAIEDTHRKYGRMLKRLAE